MYICIYVYLYIIRIYYPSILSNNVSGKTLAGKKEVQCLYIQSAFAPLTERKNNSHTHILPTRRDPYIYNTNRYNISLPPGSHCKRLFYKATILASRIEFCFYSNASHYLRARTERIRLDIYNTMGTYTPLLLTPFFKMIIAHTPRYLTARRLCGDKCREPGGSNGTISLLSVIIIPG